MTTLFTLGEVSRRLAVPIHRILYLLSSRKIDEPDRVAGRRVWTDEQIEQISEQLSFHGEKEAGNGA